MALVLAKTFTLLHSSSQQLPCIIGIKFSLSEEANNRQSRKAISRDLHLNTIEHA